MVLCLSCQFLVVVTSVISSSSSDFQKSKQFSVLTVHGEKAYLFSFTILQELCTRTMQIYMNFIYLFIHLFIYFQEGSLGITWAAILIDFKIIH